VWPRPSEVLSVGLSSGEIAWQLGKGSAQVADRSAHGSELGSLMANLAAPAGRLPPVAVHIVAGSSVARHWLQVAPPGIRSLAELRALVQSRAEQLFGSDAGWLVAADWQASRPFLCAAVPGDVDLLASSLAKDAAGRARIATSLTQALERYASELPAQGWAALHEPQALHCLYLLAGHLVYFRTAAVAAHLRGQDLELVVKIEIDRSAALAGGLPVDPVTTLSLLRNPGETQALSAVHLASKRPHSPVA
jgi:hypothetical protein